jgi:hypothetical protein
MITVLCSSEKSRLAFLVYSTGRMVVVEDASFVGIVRSSPHDVSAFVVGCPSATDGLVVRAVFMALDSILPLLRSQLGQG